MFKGKNLRDIYDETYTLDDKKYPLPSETINLGIDNIFFYSQ